MILLGKSPTLIVATEPGENPILALDRRQEGAGLVFLLRRLFYDHGPKFVE